jgi:type VI secretion system protein ImpL
MLKLALVIVGLVLALLLLGTVLYLARRRAAGKPFAAAPERAWAPAMKRLLAPSKAAFAVLRQRAPQLRARYEHPLVMLAGDSGSGKTTLLQGSGLHGEAAGPDHPEPGQLTYFDFNQGMVLEVGGAYLAIDAGRDAPLWRALARQLQLYRPRRPLDALVLCLPADSLGDDMETLEVRAGVLQRRVWELQRQIGLRLPVTVLLTCSDRLPGFASLAASVPPGLRSAMLGWSNPRDSEAPFAPGEAAEACDSIANSVAQLQAELMAASVPLADPDDFFLLPSAIDGLRPALAVFLKRLMGAGTECESPTLRGVYLCGDGGAGRAPAFVHDLLATKVLAESSLARPLRNQVFSRNRRVRAWRWATAALVLIWGGALVHAWFDLGQRTDRLLATVQLIAADRQRAREVHDQGKHIDLKTYLDSTAKIVSAMASSNRTLTTVALPLSWHLRNDSSLDKDIEDSFSAALRDIVLRTIGKGLNERAAKLAGLTQDPVTTEIDGKAGCKLVPVQETSYLPHTQATDMDAFQELKRYVDDVDQFGRMLDTFARLQKRGQGNLDEFQKLGDYSGAFALSQEETHRESYLTKAVRDYDPGASALGGPELYRAGLRCGFKARSEAFYTRLLDNSDVLQLSRHIAANMRPGGARDVDTFLQLSAQLHKINEWLTAPASAWLHAEKPAFGKPFTDLVQRVGTTDLLGDDISTDFRKRADNGLVRLHDNLTEQSDELGGVQVVERSGDGSKLQLTPALAHLDTLISALLHQPFMTPPPADMVHAVPDGAPVLWNLGTLNQTLTLTADQHDYLAHELGNFPSMFQGQVKSLANRRLGARLVAGVAAAAEPGRPGPELYERLGQSAKALAGLLEALRALGMNTEADALAGTLAAQSEGGLAWLDQGLDDSRVYLPRDGDFSWWSGSRNPAAQGYTDGSPQGLDEYLSQQHDHIEASVKLAQPLLRLGAPAGAAASRDSAMVQRWKGIAAELERYNLKQPGSRIAALEAYVRGELSEIDQMNCLDKRGPAINLRAGDYFSQRANLLMTKLTARCSELGRSGGGAAYAALAGQFRRTLAHRFPFAPAAGDTGLASEPDDVIAFLQAWDRYGPDAQRLLARGVTPGAAMRRREFLAAALEVHGFLAPLLPAADGGPAPGYDLKVLFRVNERGEADNFNALRGEVDGNKIVEWTLRVGDQAVSWKNGAANEVRQLRWRYGMPIVLTLRWADNLPGAPYEDGNDGNLSVSGSEVRYTYSEPWALLRMLAGRRNGAGAGRYETLGFEFPTQAPGQAKPGRSRVFLRMALSPANQKETLSFPNFPFDAPGNDLITAMAKP